MRGKVTMLAMVMLLLFSFFLFLGCGGVESETVGEENAVAEPACLQEPPTVKEIPGRETPDDETVDPEPAETVIVTSGFFQCAELEIAVRREINKLDGELTVADVEELTSLRACPSLILSLSGLEYATNLKSLLLSGEPMGTSGQLTDIAPLGGLTNLIELHLGWHKIMDITPLSSLTNLTSLELSNNQITNITPLSGLINLRKLSLGACWNIARGNRITDAAPLSALTNLTELYLAGNQITDIAPLSALTNLIRLELGNNQITDVAPLGGLTNLTDLRLVGNQITDITPLVELTNLSHLLLFGNPLSFIPGSQNVASIKILHERGLSDIRLNSVSEIFRCANLENIAREAINKPDGKLSATDLEKLTSLSIPSYSVVLLNGLEYATNLKTLHFLGPEACGWWPPDLIVDITPLSGLTNLTELWLGGNQITDIAPLSGLTNLTELSLGRWGWDNQIIDITPLSGLINLTDLWIEGNQVVDLTPLSALTSLTELGLANNQITDITALINNPGLSSGDSVSIILGNQIPETQIEELRAKGVSVH